MKHEMNKTRRRARRGRRPQLHQGDRRGRSSFDTPGELSAQLACATSAHEDEDLPGADADAMAVPVIHRAPRPLSLDPVIRKLISVQPQHENVLNLVFTLDGISNRH